jgi:hypothetical protein
MNPIADPRVAPPGSWKYRRRIIHGALFFIAGFLVYLVERRPDAAVTLTLAPALVAGALGIIGSYVFGAVIDDKNARSTAP